MTSLSDLYISIGETIILLSPIMTAQAGRLRRIYDDQERAVIDPFKPDYLKATTPTGRKTIAQVHIFPALFNHWASRGVELNTKEMQTRTEVSNTFLNTSFYVQLNGVTGSPEMAEKCLAYKEKTSIETRKTVSVD